MYLHWSITIFFCHYPARDYHRERAFERPSKGTLLTVYSFPNDLFSSFWNCSRWMRRAARRLRARTYLGMIVRDPLRVSKKRFRTSLIFGTKAFTKKNTTWTRSSKTWSETEWESFSGPHKCALVLKFHEESSIITI